MEKLKSVLELTQMLRMPVADPADYGIVSRRLQRNSLPFFKVEGETPEGYCGIEWECAWAPGTTQSRNIYAALRNIHQRNSLVVNVRESSSDPFYDTADSSLREAVRRLVFSDRTKLLAQAPHYDGGGIECVFCPMSLAAIRAAEQEFRIMFELADDFGFTPLRGGDGIHLNMDLSLYGSTMDEQVETCARMLRFAFANYDYIVRQSLRRWTYQRNSDIPSMLGDIFRVRSNQELEVLFMEQKSRFLDTIRAGTSLKAFNIGIRTDRRPVLEIRWFGSTTKVAELFSIVDFAFAQAEYFRANDTTSLERFANFVKSTFDENGLLKYGHLYEHMQANEYSAQFMNLGTHVPQTILVA